MTDLTALPAAALQHHVAILGTSDAGKTYAAKGEVEGLLTAGARVCVIDPTGVWWGLRLGPDGRAPSPFEVAIFGGDHGDVAIGDASGARLAEAVAGGAFSCIVDVSRMTVGARTRLFADFAETLAQVNRRPLHLVVDEAHLFAPQGRVQDPTSGRMVGAANHLVSAGRALGLRIMLLSQRPAKLHKDSLTQVQTLVAMLNVAPQDRAAVKDWIAAEADGARAAEILASLPSLPVGEGWVWAPRLGVLEKVRFRAIATFDSSAAPEDGRARPVLTLAALDLDALRAALAVEEPEAPIAGRPAHRKKAIAPAAVGPTPADLEAAEARGYARGLAEGERREWRRSWDAAMAALTAAFAADRDARTAEREARMAAPDTAHKDIVISPGAGRLGASAAKLMDVLQRWRGAPIGWSDAAVLAVLAPTGGSFNAARKSLIDGRHVLRGDDDLLTVRGPPTGAALYGAAIVTAWVAKLGGSAGRILRYLQMEGGATKPRISADLGLVASGGSWNHAWKKLRANGLAVEEDGRWRLARVLRDLEPPAGSPPC